MHKFSMASAMVADPSLSPEGPPPSAGLFSKFARSPSRKHRPRPSSDSIETAPPPPPSKPTKLRPRPGIQRTTTESAAPVPLGNIREQPKRDDAKNPTPVEGKMDISGFALADAVRRPTFKVVDKRPSEVPDVPSFNGAALNQNASGHTNHSANPYQHIHEMSSKRMATLDYMRKA